MNALPQSTDNAVLDPRLRRLVLQANEFVPLYRRHWQGTNVANIDNARDFAALPVISKAELLAVPTSERVDRRYATGNLQRESTSGSTGQPFTMYFDRRAWLRRRIRFVRALLACGYRFGQRLMLISSRHSSTLMRIANWRYVDLELGEQALCATYQQVKPQTLYGPLSSLLVLAQRLSRTQTNNRPKLVISTAEQLTATHRRLLENAFQAPVADFYGSTELGLVAWRKPDSIHYECAEKDFYLEFLPTLDHSTMERLIVTDRNPGPVPLIRFDTGDLVSRDRHLPKRPICEFAGREVDCLQLPDGEQISPYQVTMALEQLAAVDRYEVVQRANQSIDVVVWTQDKDPSSAVRGAQAIVEQLCRRQVPVAAHRSKEELVLTGRKIRPVRSEAKKA